MNPAKAISNRNLISITVCYALALAVITIFLYHFLEQRELISPRAAFISTVGSQILFMVMAQIHTIRLGNTNVIKLFLVGICCFFVAETLWQLVEVSQQQNLSVSQGLNKTLQYSLQYAPLVAISAVAQLVYVKFSPWYKPNYEQE